MRAKFGGREENRHRHDSSSIMPYIEKTCATHSPFLCTHARRTARRRLSRKFYLTKVQPSRDPSASSTSDFPSLPSFSRTSLLFFFSQLCKRFARVAHEDAVRPAFFITPPCLSNNTKIHHHRTSRSNIRTHHTPKPRLARFPGCPYSCIPSPERDSRYSSMVWFVGAIFPPGGGEEGLRKSIYETRLEAPWRTLVPLLALQLVYYRTMC
ncbi:hypothetical protein B0H34DRAFT_249615 [Crassisporium funariophilum]|nr:hypothetical protein B0H34DRAFT_249615 [Crassisporium funariophilum]